jgi:hypothetical protein
MGLYSSIESAQSAWRELLMSGDGYPYQFYRIEERMLDAGARQYESAMVVFEGSDEED